jgi:hypothetical protein
MKAALKRDPVTGQKGQSQRARPQPAYLNGHLMDSRPHRQGPRTLVLQDADILIVDDNLDGRPGESSPTDDLNHDDGIIA